MKNLAILLSGLALTALPPASALADTVGFAFDGPNFSAIGNFTATPTQPPGVYVGKTASGLATIVGSANVFGTTVAITGMAPVNMFLGNDNLYFTGATMAEFNMGRPFDFQGFAFTLSNGDAITVFSDDGQDFEILGDYSNGAEILTETAAIAITPGSVAVTPEPASLALIGTGALGIVGVLRRKLRG